MITGHSIGKATSVKQKLFGFRFTYLCCVCCLGFFWGGGVFVWFLVLGGGGGGVEAGV